MALTFKIRLMRSCSVTIEISCGGDYFTYKVMSASIYEILNCYNSNESSQAVRLGQWHRSLPFPPVGVLSCGTVQLCSDAMHEGFNVLFL